MFKIDYRIINHAYDDFYGENGFFQMNCNDFLYGDMYSRDIERFMFTISIIDWFERFIRVAESLFEHPLVALSDVESYNTWIVFERRNNNDITVSIKKGEKKDGTQDIEFAIENVKHGEWEDQNVDFHQMRQEICLKANEYFDEILEYYYNRKVIELDAEIIKLISDLRNRCKNIL